MEAGRAVHLMVSKPIWHRHDKHDARRDKHDQPDQPSSCLASSMTFFANPDPDRWSASRVLIPHFVTRPPERFGAKSAQAVGIAIRMPFRAAEIADRKDADKNSAGRNEPESIHECSSSPFWRIVRDGNGYPGWGTARRPPLVGRGCFVRAEGAYPDMRLRIGAEAGH